MSYTIFCFIPGSESTFSIHIEETKIVDDLKVAIKERMALKFKDFESANLRLHQAEINGNLNQKQRIAQPEQESQNLNGDMVLDEEVPLARYFGVGPPEGRKYYIIVVLPEGESNHSLIVQHRRRRRPCASWSSNDSDADVSPRLTLRITRIVNAASYSTMALLSSITAPFPTTSFHGPTNADHPLPPTHPQLSPLWHRSSLTLACPYRRRPGKQ